MREKHSFPVNPDCRSRGPGRVLVIAEDPWARDTIRVLLGSMGCHCVMACNAEQARAKLRQENPDAAIADTYRTTAATSPGLSGLDEICLRLRGRIIIVTGEDHDPEVAALIQKYRLPQILRERLLQDLWSTLNSLPKQSSVFRRVISARLIFDSFGIPFRVRPGAERQPGDRNHGRPMDIRRFAASGVGPTRSCRSCIAHPRRVS